MKFKSILKSFPVFFIAAALALVFAIITLFFSKGLAIAELVMIAAAAVFVFIYYDILNVRRRKLFNGSADADIIGADDPEKLPMPVAVCGPDGEITWSTELFERQVVGKSPSGYGDFTEMIKETGVATLADSSGRGISMSYDGKDYIAYPHLSKDGDLVLYLVDITRYQRMAGEYLNTRPTIVIMMIDNMDELSQDYRESDCAAIRNGIEKLIELWLADYPCFFGKVGDDKFFIVAARADADNMIERKFDILDKVRKYTYDNKYAGATLSIGVGNGYNYAECDKNARLSLDMALGRGGDQAVVRTKDSYEFFGGVSKSIEKSNKVKSRIIASALAELINGSENVYVMGHRFPDFDAMGAAFGVALIAKSLGKNAFVVTDVERSMAKPLLERAQNEGFADMIIPVEKAVEAVSQGKKNLLIVVDTHIKNFVESPELLELSKLTVVIDHHRKAVNYIDNAVIFFHDPGASSASEMVTELIEYIPAVTRLGSFVADGLMAGIMLDTKNFILRSSSRTFEAAAFLKNSGADTVRTRKLFANDIESCHIRNRIVGNAQKYHNCAIAVADTQSEDIRMICAQAADELLNISGVDASFVIFETDGMVCVSARSMGAVNVQVVMEYMNGGGHQTMAAAQVRDGDIKTVTEQVMRSIDRYNESLTNRRKES